ncbi:MAG: cyclodeaminase/cyclohydrolase family protein, partial [Nocardioidaceae bacterium]|nr:cyclodeaminase/cyclohydrolase family protein [Nocardioidaceae bacterium]
MLDARVADLVDEVAARTPAPGAGAVTGLVAVLSAALAQMVARFSDDAETVAECARLRRRVEPLADA